MVVQALCKLFTIYWLCYDTSLAIFNTNMIANFHHVTFLSTDLARSRAFYQGILDLKPDNKRPLMSFDGIWYDVKPGQQIHLMRLTDAELNLPPPAYGGRDRHVAFVVSDLAALIVKLDAAGIAHTLSQSGRRALFCRDPDQNALEFIEVV